MEDDARKDALDVLRDARVWRLTGGRWRAVGQALEAMAGALVADDSAAFQAAVCQLELAGPVRAVRVEDVSTLPAPHRVRERINELVHTLDGSRRTERRDDDGDAAGAAG
ncbi:MAG: CATRA system-associated protein [Pseudonocardiaceae bacterium]